MTDEAAEPRRAADGAPPPVADEATAEIGTSPADGNPPVAVPDAPAADPDAPAGPVAGGPPPGATPPPPGPPPPGAGYGQPGGTAFARRYGLVRPREGRYLAGVCAAIGRATNTDPVLWRVLLAVLGFFGGIGILVYVAAWLLIPAEGDSASPIESMLGRGRSSTSPVTVILLGVLVAVMFAFIVTDGFRSVLLGTAILIGGALLLNREAARQRPGPPPGPVPAAGPEPTTGFPTADIPAPGVTTTRVTGVDIPGAEPYTTAPAPTFPPAAPGAAPGSAAQPPLEPAGHGPAGPAHPLFPAGQLGPHPVPAAHTAGYPTPPPPVSGPGAYPVPGPPAGGYRPPFAPHGPYAPGAAYPPPGRAAPAPKPPKPPRERSPLGAATFSMIFVVIGLVAVLDLAGAVPIGPSAYFAGVLVTTALGLLVGAWFGRARWLIAIGLASALALGISTLAESSHVERLQGRGPVLWQPASVGELASGYENSFGDATLDLTAVDFTTSTPPVTVQVNFGRLVVIVPEKVDVTAFTDVNAGDATVFGQRWSGVQGTAREVTDLGPDGRGGGTLRLYLHVNAGELEVRR